MSTLFNDIDVEVVKLTLTPKAGGSTVDYYFAVDYWPIGSVYATNPTFYPLLVAGPAAQRAVGPVSWVPQGTQIQLYGDSHLDRHGFSLLDLFTIYEIHNAAVQILYYPKALAATTTHSDTANIRQRLQVVSQ